jgi:CheY-like chemotaxis protein
VKFTPKGGRVQVTLQRINSHIEVSVMDTGEGIAPQFMPHVFDRFRQADASTTRKHGGLGLGLSIVKQIVELHGGSVLGSSPGKGQGATFTVRLPLSVAHAEHVDSAMTLRVNPAADVPFDIQEAACNQLAGVSVVAVDDEPDSVAVIQRLLTACGAVVRTATSAAEAFALIQSDPPAVLVSDIGMPHEDGYALIRRIRTLPMDKGGRVRAVALTAYARTVDRVRALEAGFQMHISKPVEPAELIVSVAALAKTLDSAQSS